MKGGRWYRVPLGKSAHFFVDGRALCNWKLKKGTPATAADYRCRTCDDAQIRAAVEASSRGEASEIKP